MAKQETTASDPADPAPRVDGRSLRRERTRTAIVEGVLALVAEGELRPTAEQIAARAGVSERSVFQHFPERDALIEAVVARQRERVGRLVQRIPDDGPLAERLDAFVAQRARIWEAVTPVRRAALLQEPFSETIHDGLTSFRGIVHAEVARIFAPELGRLDPAARADTLAAMSAIAEWPAWESLRAHQGLAPADAARAVRRALAALVASG
jgi:TetR/AcrR family transcriptional regulator, regulator of autoinduction and epiphytic fitness